MSEPEYKWKTYGHGLATVFLYDGQAVPFTGNIKDWYALHGNVSAKEDNRGQLVIMNERNEIAAVGKAA